MATDVLVPTLGESITEATLGAWIKKPGDPVKADEPIASLETDKVAVEVPVAGSGTMGEHLVAKATRCRRRLIADRGWSARRRGAAAAAAAQSPSTRRAARKPGLKEDAAPPARGAGDSDMRPDAVPRSARRAASTGLDPSRSRAPARTAA
jgi:2-oxoglutarate dehydrogenase E2 component (dihydrolipoamide succinyltransferase)